MILYLILPGSRVLISAGLRLVCKDASRVGTCKFMGTKPFVNVALEGLRKLCEMDSQIHAFLIQSKTFIFWNYKSIISDNRLHRIYSVPDETVAWGAHGIITRLVYAYFVEVIIGKGILRSKEDSASRFTEARTKTADWLDSKGFAQELVAVFRAPLAWN